MTSQPRLPGDILLEILAAAETPYAARMMAVSRFLYVEGAKVILRRPIYLYREKELVKFLAFLDTDLHRLDFVHTLDIRLHTVNEDVFVKFLGALYNMPNIRSLSIALHSRTQLHQVLAILDMRAQNSEYPGLYEVLHSLTLDIFGLEAPSANKLVRALPRMCNLRSLSIASGDLLLEVHPDLASAFSAITSLKSFQMGYTHDHGISLLQNLRSQLVSVNLNFLPIGGGLAFFDFVSDVELLQLHPVALLAHSQASLEKLDAFGWTTHSALPPNVDCVYPKMRHLDLEHTSIPLTMPYIRAYPNLTHLRYETSECEMVDSESTALHDHQHRLNVADQLASGLTWRCLQDFHGSVVDLYMLGLTCRIERVYLQVVHPKVFYQLAAALAHAQPRHLELSNWPGKPTGPDEETFTIMRGQGASRLESLHFTAGLGQGDEGVDFPVLMENLKDSLSHSSLRDLKAKIRLSGLDPRPDDLRREFAHLQRHCLRASLPALRPSPEPTDYPLVDAEQSANRFDLEHYTRSLVSAVPTLREVEITLLGPRDRWRRATLVSGRVQCEDKESV
ncbi:hypothetical protein FKP32DRAFT_1618713 [Trametes sanguinea]|nr:hypothetical protein FKP32DRAFT_1618713 [Trametes sanguinea]